MPTLPPNNGWNSSYRFGSKRKKQKSFDTTADNRPPDDEAPRCACGNAFPLDTHPQTKAKICASCYKEVVKDGWVVDFACRKKIEADEEVYHYYVEAISETTAKLKALSAVEENGFATYRFVSARTIKQFKQDTIILLSGQEV